MHRINRLEWDEENIEHIARHNVLVSEVEEVCYSRPLIVRLRKDRWLVYGQTLAGRYLFVVIGISKEGIARCITARTMTAKERRTYLSPRRRT